MKNPKRQSKQVEVMTDVEQGSAAVMQFATLQ